MKTDPDNRLFGRMNRHRLEAEAVRDNLLAVSGELDTTMGGVATRDFNSGRRTLYLMTIRSDRSGFGPLFDAADANVSVERRTVSTVAPQALFLLNNPFLLDQTHLLAQRLAKAEPQNASARIQAAYQLLYSRPPTPAGDRDRPRLPRPRWPKAGTDAGQRENHGRGRPAPVGRVLPAPALRQRVPLY